MALSADGLPCCLHNCSQPSMMCLAAQSSFMHVCSLQSVCAHRLLQEGGAGAQGRKEPPWPQEPPAGDACGCLSCMLLFQSAVALPAWAAACKCCCSFAAHRDRTLLACSHVLLLLAALHERIKIAAVAQVGVHAAQHCGPWIHCGTSAVTGLCIPATCCLPLCSHMTALRTHPAVLTTWQQPSVVV